MPEDQIPRLPGDVWPRAKPMDWGWVVLRLHAVARERQLRQNAESEAEPVPCVVCSPWPPQDRLKLRAALAVIPLRADVCDKCLRAWWEGCQSQD